MEDYQGAKYRREFERFYSCGVLWKALAYIVGVIMHVFV